MAVFRGLKCEMSVFGLLLVVYFMSITGVHSVTSSTTVISLSPAKSTSLPSPSQNTTAASIAPAATTTPAPQSTPAQPTSVTQGPIIQPTSAPPPSGRKFDGASFVGGIILGIVLTLIVIFVFKWWQARNKSYHSL